MRRSVFLFFFCLVLGSVAFSDAIAMNIVGKEVEYSAGNLKMKGFLAYPDIRKGQRPGVLVVHEWWGHNEYARGRAKQLAKLGYVALAVDMYGDGKQAAHPDDAKKFASEATKNFDVATERFNAALDYLKAQPQTDPSRIAAIGYCFGGGVVLNMARQGADLRGVASFHGALAPAKPAEKGAVKAKILVLTGAADSMVTADQVDAFKKEMTAAGADFSVIAYPGAKHSFTNPAADKYAKQFNLDLAYNRKADMQSWAELKHFLRKIFAMSAVRKE
ncbi:MAG TPA: dienelactone hydrolase family protein [Dissulfurispiraceae bacterium]|nr:dienelactone hydrolase family protein [Dissulfurispiraceae bacterium]